MLLIEHASNRQQTFSANWCNSGRVVVKHDVLDKLAYVLRTTGAVILVHLALITTSCGLFGNCENK